MTELRRPAQLYIWLLALTAAGLAVALLPRAARPDGRAACLVVALTTLMTLAHLFPLKFSFHTKLTLDTTVIFAAVLLFEPGIAVLVAGTGTLLALTIQRAP